MKLGLLCVIPLSVATLLSHLYIKFSKKISSKRTFSKA